MKTHLNKDPLGINPESHAFGQGTRWERWIKDNRYKLQNAAGLFCRV